MALTIPQRVLAGVSLILLLLSALIASEYFDSVGRKADLQKRLATLQTTVNKINASNASGDNTDPLLREPAFPTNPPNLDLASLVLTSASASGVTTGTIEATTQSTEKVGANTYRTVSLDLNVTGTLPQILDFFDRMRAGGIRTLVFDNIHLEPTNGHWNLQLEVVAYAQPG
jgi:FlaG/FlaF family flagellin (archaellin)